MTNYHKNHDFKKHTFRIYESFQSPALPKGAVLQFALLLYQQSSKKNLQQPLTLLGFQISQRIVMDFYKDLPLLQKQIPYHPCQYFWQLK